VIIVVDTSVLVDLFRGLKTPPADRLRNLEWEGIPFVVPVICFQEVLQGAKDEHEWKLLEGFFGSQDLLGSLDPVSSHREAARIYFDCRRKGLTIRSSIDCLIAQIVLERDGVLLHDDNDFEHIQKVRPLKTMRS
jgi:predicted nucleic acid-binding protein